MIRAFLLLLATASAALGNTLLVPEGYTTIQATLDAAQPGDVISVAPGIYEESVSFRQDGLTLQSRVKHAAIIDAGGSRAAVSCESVAATVEDFTITGGKVYGVFGGAAVSDTHESRVSYTIRGNLITGNGFVGICMPSGSNAWIEGNMIIGHSKSSSGIELWNDQGGLGSQGTIVDNYISGFDFAGIWILGDLGGEYLILNNTLTTNGLAGLLVGRSHLLLQNNILTGSQYGVYFTSGYDPDLDGLVGQYLTIDHNDTWQNSVSDYFAELATICATPACSGCTSTCPDLTNAGPFTPTPGTGNISADPMLGTDGVSPQSGSPVIDAGEGADVPSGVTTDLSGQPRIVNGQVDIGAVESTAPVASTAAPQLCGAGVGEAVMLSLLFTALLRLRKSAL